MKLSTKISIIALSITTLLCILVAYIFNTNLRSTLYGEKYSETIYAIHTNIRGIEQRFTQALLDDTTIQKILYSLEQYTLSAINNAAYNNTSMLKEKGISLTVYSNMHTIISQFGLDIDTNDIFTVPQRDDVAFSIPSEDTLLIHKKIALPDGNGYIVASQRLLIHNTSIPTLFNRILTEATSMHSSLSSIQNFISLLYVRNTPSTMHTVEPHLLKLIQNYVQANSTTKKQLFYSIDTIKHTMLALYYEPTFNMYAIANINIAELDATIHSFYLFSLSFIACYLLIAMGILLLSIRYAFNPFEKILYFFNTLVHQPSTHTAVDTMKIRHTLSEQKYNKEIHTLAETFITLLDEQHQQRETIKILTASQENFLNEYTLAQKTQNLFNARLAQYHTNSEILFHICHIQEYALNTIFYDSYFLDEDTLFIALGESNIRSIASSIVLGYIQGMVRSGLSSTVDLARLLDEINTTVQQHTIRGLCIDLFIATINLQTGILTYINAGKQQPILIRNGLILEDMCENLHAVGEWKSLYLKPYPISLQEGDTLLLYTQGTLQLHNKENEYYSRTHLKNFLSKHSNDTANIVVTELEHTLHLFSAGVTAPKEVLCLCFQYKPNVLREKQLYSTMIGADTHALQLQSGNIYTYNPTQ